MDIFTRVKKLNLPKKRYVVLGSGILEVLGIRKAGDLDIMVTKDVFDSLKASGEWQYKRKKGEFGDTMELLRREDAQIYFHIYGKNGYDFFMEDESRIELINDIYFASLSDLIRIKKEWGREKDLKDITLIEEYLKADLKTED